MERWVSGLNQRFAKPSYPTVPQVRILYAPPRLDPDTANETFGSRFKCWAAFGSMREN
jgi:hypothetical protein